jgi:large subunit ribosomal protein L5
MGQKLGWSRVVNAHDNGLDREQVAEDKTSKVAAKKKPARKPAVKKAAIKEVTVKKRASKKKARSSTVDRSEVEATESKASAVAANVPRMKQVYLRDVVTTLMGEFGYKNRMQVPNIEKIVLNIGLGEALESNSAVGAAKGDLERITGQRPIENRAKVSIANFKLREGSVVGSSVTLRGNRMWQFLDRFMNITLPRVRDFRGLSRSAFDGRGNYSLGMREQSTFPEIDYNEIDRMRGLQLTFVTTANTDEEGRRLLELLGMPFVHVGESIAVS